MRDLPRETQLKGLEQVQLRNPLEGEIAEDSIPKALWKEMKDTDKQRKGQILQVREEGEVMFPSPSLQPTVDNQGHLLLLPHLRIDSLQIEAVLDQDLHL